MGFEFTNPAALLLLLLIPATIYVARLGRASLPPARARASLAARIAILLLMALALAGFRVKLPSRDLAVIFVIDVSASVTPDAQRQAVDTVNREIARAAPRDYVGVVAFGREPAVELAPTRKEELGDFQLAGVSSNPPKDYTNIAGALRLATALIPESATGRLVLISDGGENLERGAEEAELLRAGGVEVHTLALGPTGGEARGEVSVRELSAPENLAEGEAFDLRATVDSTRDTGAVLRVFRNDSLVAERPVQLSASGENVFILPQRNDQKGFYTYRAVVETLDADTFAQNNAREAFTLVEGRPKTLYLHGDREPSPAITRVLSEGSFAADVRSSAGVPTTLAGFQDYDLVIFDNVPATALTTEQMRMAAAYVKDLGGGFVMIGGDQSFGPGGYYKTPIEEMLPVSLDVRQKKHFPSLAIVLVVDRSGSMAGEKMMMAKEAAAATVDFLSDRDSVGVVAFADDAQPAVSLKKVEDKRAITRDIRNIQLAGGTNIYPGIKMASDWLRASEAQIKHVILLSDGMSEEGDYPALTREMREANITLTSVAVGQDADGRLMELLARWGGGRFYDAQSAENLPRIFTREAFLASKETIIEEPFTPRLVRPTQATAGLDWGSAPQLLGYVGTAERDSVQSPAIMSLVSHKDDPVYAVWQYGLGRSAAFTSDAKSRWAAGWMGWSGFGQFWTQMFRDTLRREGASDLRPRVEIGAGRGRVVVEAVSPDGNFRNNLSLQAHVVAPDFTATDVRLDQTAAGRYEAEFPATTRGAYLVSVTEQGGEAAPIAGAVNSYSPEFGIAPADTDLLARISEATGGSSLSLSQDAEGAAAGLFGRPEAKTRPVEIWETLVLLALLLLPFDVGVRRLNITREQWTQARDWVTARLPRPAKITAETQTAPGMQKLKASRSRVRLTGNGADSIEPAPIRIQPPPPAPVRPHPATDLPDSPVIAPASSGTQAKQESISTKAEPARPGEDRPLASRLLDARRKKRE